MWIEQCSPVPSFSILQTSLVGLSLCGSEIQTVAFVWLWKVRSSKTVDLHFSVALGFQYLNIEEKQEKGVKAKEGYSAYIFSQTSRSSNFRLSATSQLQGVTTHLWSKEASDLWLPLSQEHPLLKRTNILKWQSSRPHLLSTDWLSGQVVRPAHVIAHQNQQWKDWKAADVSFSMRDRLSGVVSLLVGFLSVFQPTNPPI